MTKTAYPVSSPSARTNARLCPWTNAPLSLLDRGILPRGHDGAPVADHLFHVRAGNRIRRELLAQPGNLLQEWQASEPANDQLQRQVEGANRCAHELNFHGIDVAIRMDCSQNHLHDFEALEGV